MELDPVVETFEADVAPFLAGIEEAIRAARAFADAVHADIAALGELQAALDSLPLERTVHVRVDTSGMPEAAAAAAAAGGAAGAPESQAAAWERTQAVLDQVFAGYEDLAAQEDAAWEAGDRAAGSAAAHAPVWEEEAVQVLDAANGWGAFAGAADQAAAAAEGIDRQLAGLVWESAESAAAADRLTAAFGEQADALHGAAAAAGAWSAVQETAAEEADRAAAARQFEVDTLRAVTAAKIAVAKAQLAVNQAYDEAAAGQLAYLALSREIGQETLQDAAHFALAGNAARNYADDEAAAAAVASALGVDLAAAAEAATQAQPLPRAGLRARLDEQRAADAAALAAARARAQEAAAANGRGGGGRWGILGLWGLRGRSVPLYGGLAAVSGAHLLADSLLEVAAVAIPAGIAVTAFAAAAVPALQDIYTQMKAVYVTSTALGRNIYPLTGGFSKLADAVKPKVLMLFGEALAVASHNTGELTALARGAGTALDQLGARTAAALTSGGMATFLASGPADLAKIGDIIGNIFGTVGNLLKVMPGYAEVLLGGVDALTHAMESLTGSPIGQWGAKAFLAMHGFWLWAGLGATAAVKLGNVLVGLAARFGLASEGALAFDAVQFGTGIKLLGSYAADAAVALVTFSGAEDVAAASAGMLDGAVMALGAVNPLVWVGAAAGGLAALVFWLSRASSATQQYDSAVNGALGNAPVGQLGADIAARQAATLDRLHAAQAALNSTQEYTVQLNLHTGVQQRYVTSQYLHQQQVIAGYKGELGTLAGYLRNYNTLLHAAGGNLTFLNEAGITANDITGAGKAKMAQYIIEVKAAADAQKALALGTGRAAAARNAQVSSFMTETLPALQKVTQAEDAVMNVVLGGQQSFIAFQQSMGSMGSEAKKSGASLDGLNKHSLTLASTYYGTAVPALQKLTDSLQQQGISTGALRKVLATGAGEMTRWTRHSMAARSVLVALINNALGPGTVSLRSLNTWVKHNSVSLRGMNSIIAASTIKAGSLAGVLRSQLNAQFHAALLQASHASRDLRRYTDMLVHNKAATSAGRGVRAQLIHDLRQAGFSARQARRYVDGLSASLHRLHSKTITVTAVMRTLGSLPAGVTSASSVTLYQQLGGGRAAKGRAAGWRVPGHGTGDTVPALLEPGEAVVPRHLVPAVAPFLAAHHVPGFAHGTFVGHRPPHPAWNMGDVMNLWMRETWGKTLLHHRGPVSAAEMTRLLAATAGGARGVLGIAWQHMEHQVMSAYGAPDLRYWKILARERALPGREAARAARLTALITSSELTGQHGQAAYYARQLAALGAADARKRQRYAAEETALSRRLARLRGEWVFHPAPGNPYLPPGGGGSYGASRHPSPLPAARPEVHVHLHGDLAEEQLFTRLQARALDYGYDNSGAPTGIWQPGG